MRVILGAVLLALSACGNAAGKVDGARAGATIKLAGNQGALTLKGHSWSPAITIDASNATFTAIVLNGVTGIHFKGGTVIGPGGKSYAIHILKSRDIAIDGMTITGAGRGVVMDRSQDIAVRNTRLTGLGVDGIDIASSQRVVISGNSCSKFTPKLAAFDATGKLIDGDHPDCIQGWSKLAFPPTSDVTVSGNTADGMMQGVFFRDPGVNGGFDRITIRDNVLHTGFGNAVFVEGARDAIVRGNRVSAVRGATHVKSGNQVKANIVFKSSTGRACGNQVANIPRHEAMQPCN